MRALAKFAFTAGAAAAVVLGTATAGNAQYRYGWPTYNGCPPGYTVQGGVCQPYQGPVGGGWRTYNGCPPGYTVQGGMCRPYQGPVGGGPSWNGCPPGYTIQGGACRPYRGY
jgi:hypothetical protein